VAKKQGIGSETGRRRFGSERQNVSGMGIRENLSNQTRTGRVTSPDDEMKIYGFKLMKPPQTGPRTLQFLHGQFKGLGIHYFGVPFGRRFSVKWYVKL